MSTLTTSEQTPEDITTSNELDLLIPPSMQPAKKFIVSLLLLAAAISLTYVVNNGYLHPSAFAPDDYTGPSLSSVNRAEGVFSVTVLLENNSARSVRLTDVTVDAAGADLVDVALSAPRLEHARTGNSFIVQDAPPDNKSDGASLPAELRPKGHFDGFWDGEYVLSLWLRPTSCETVTSTWGTLHVTVDFGESSLPPLAETTIFERPLWSAEGRADGWTPIWNGQEMVTSNGPLEVACEALR